MILAGYGFLIFNYSTIFSGILFGIGWLFLTVYSYNFFESKSKKIKGIGIFCIATFIAIVLVTSWVKLQSPSSKLRAFIIPANEPTPDTRCGELSPNSVKVFLGDSVGVTDNNNPMKLISAFGVPFLTAKKVGNSIQISIELFDKEGASIAKIKDNKFVGQLSENLDIVSPDPHGIDIFDKTDDKLIFHFRYLNPQAIQILGEFYPNKGKRPIRLNGAGVALPNGMTYSNACFDNLRGYAMGF